jgi:hypothetical protein
MKQVDLYGRVRHSVLIEGISQREAARIFGIDPRKRIQLRATHAYSKLNCADIIA